MLRELEGYYVKRAWSGPGSGRRVPDWITRGPWCKLARTRKWLASSDMGLKRMDEVAFEPASVEAGRAPGGIGGCRAGQRRLRF